ncbi:FKBP-type peptidyl-prolyl cis-trans isomerase [Hyphomonas sp. FCG-A18]|uniref:FKBP-type peptidyl-prolyl cis-trans isomerase n=1 Tax=Hyphomonas sp. FCG-A18 TaxID=3080019 RepID=UPI002B2D7C71|nr:FKBP-type peptidyl-prolyl cis-trans isomerase [Hyphomonas sp. FCG-A18]
MTRDDLDTVEKQVSYLLGFSQVRQMLEQGVELDHAAFANGAKTCIEGEAPVIGDDEAQAIFAAYQQTLQAKANAAQAAASGQNAAASEAFLADNAGKDGVSVTASGLQYKVVSEGEGAKPVAANTVRVHYEGKLITGEVFDSSIARGQPAEFGLSQVIAGWTEGLQLMTIGSTYEFYIPAGLAYGENGPPSIGPNQALIFQVQLIDILN